MKTAALTAAYSRPERSSSIREDRDRDGYNYETLPSAEEGTPGNEEPRFSIDLDAEHHILLNQHLKQFRKKGINRTWVVIMGAFGVVLFFYLAIA